MRRLVVDRVDRHRTGDEVRVVRPSTLAEYPGELFGSGIRLFEGVNADRVALELVGAEPTQRVTHLTYAVRER